MRKSVCTPEELNNLLTAELRRVPGCEGAAWVRVYRLRKHVRGKNWLAAFLAAGSADKRDCARALIEIERRLQTELLQYAAPRGHDGLDARRRTLVVDAEAPQSAQCRNSAAIARVSWP